VIVRSWEGRARAGSADAYLAHLTEEVVPQIRAVSGCRGVQVLRGVDASSDTFMVLTLWSDLSAIEGFSGPDPEHAVVPAEAQALLSEFDERARHFEVAWEMFQDAP